jgi:hypothetical protein
MNHHENLMSTVERLYNEESKKNKEIQEKKLREKQFREMQIKENMINKKKEYMEKMKKDKELCKIKFNK